MTLPNGYREIAADLQARIEEGEYAPGSKIPSYKELAYAYDVGVSTVQRAILVLQERALIVGVQGRGNYVVEAESAPSRASRRPGRSPDA